MRVGFLVVLPWLESCHRAIGCVGRGLGAGRGLGGRDFCYCVCSLWSCFREFVLFGFESKNVVLDNNLVFFNIDNNVVVVEVWFFLAWNLATVAFAVFGGGLVLFGLESCRRGICCVRGRFGAGRGRGFASCVSSSSCYVASFIVVVPWSAALPPLLPGIGF